MTRRSLLEDLANLVNGDFLISDAQSGWPGLGRVGDSSRPVPVTVWIGPIGRSHRNRDDVERRFQNPGSNRPIWLDEDRIPLLLGLWSSDDLVSVPRPIVVSADPLRRKGRTTRFSVFVSLELMLEASECGWAEGFNSDGELLTAFWPVRLGELVASLTGGPLHRVGESLQLALESNLDVSRPGVGAPSTDPSRLMALALEGLSLAEIGKELGITRERVRQLLNRNPEIAAQRKELAAQRRRREAATAALQLKEDRRERLESALSRRGVDPREVLNHLRQSRRVDLTARGFGIEEGLVNSLYETSSEEFAIVRPRAGGAQRHTDDAIIDYLRRCAEALSVEKLSANAYNDFAARQNFTPETWPTSQTVAKRFGGWRDACDAAGLTRSSTRRIYKRDFPPIRCRQFVDRYVGECIEDGERPTFAGFTDWSRANGGPSGATLRNRLGTWSQILAASLSRSDR